MDQLRHLELLGREELESTLGFRFQARNLLVTFHPVTLDEDPSAKPFEALLDALGAFEGAGVIFTKPNADPFGRVIGSMIDDFVSTHVHAIAFSNMGSLQYLSTMSHVDAVVGNSSSGLLEAPSLGVPTVNIGDRQRGRPRAASVVDCAAEAVAIGAAIRRALTLDCSDVINPYGDGGSAERIVCALEEEPSFRALLKKRFFDMEER